MTRSTKTILAVTFVAALYMGYKMEVNMFVPIVAWVITMGIISPILAISEEQDRVEEQLRKARKNNTRDAKND